MALSKSAIASLQKASAYKCITRKEGFYAKTLDEVAGCGATKELERALSATGLLTNMRRTLVSTLGKESLLSALIMKRLTLLVAIVLSLSGLAVAAPSSTQGPDRPRAQREDQPGGPSRRAHRRYRRHHRGRRHHRQAMSRPEDHRQ